jgi:hypothetical protein
LYGPDGRATGGRSAWDHRLVIDRAVRLAQATSSMTSAALLLAFNLVPLAGVLVGGWNVATILVLYWVENGIVGVLNIPKILLASGPNEPPTRTLDVRGVGPVVVPRSAGVSSKIGLVPFFVVHYGIFWFVHGVFVFTLPTFAALRADSFDPIGAEVGPLGLGPGDLGPNLTAVAWGAVGLAISRIASFLINYVGRREYLSISPIRQAFAPYGRLVILHLTILFGAFVSLTIGSPIGAIVVLVVLKTIVDLRLHLREHAKSAGPPQA